MTIRYRLARSLIIILVYAPSSACGFVGIAGSSRAAGRITSSSSSTSSSRFGRTNDYDDECASNDGVSSMSRPLIVPSFPIPAMDRRRALELCGGGMALSSLLLSPPDACANVDLDDDAGRSGKRKRILITGSNSGIGLDAAQRMVVHGHEVVLACVSTSCDFDGIQWMFLSFQSLRSNIILMRFMRH
jgi:hypothetical protein